MELQYIKVEKQNRYKTFVCPHNKEVQCSVKNCINCGWHPKVEKYRMEKIQQKMKEAVCNG